MQARAALAAFAPLVLAAFACSRSPAPVGSAAGEAGARELPEAVDSSPYPSPSGAPPAPLASLPEKAAPPPIDAPPPGEATRRTIASLESDPALRSSLARLRAHFGARARGPFAVQHVDLAAGRRAALVCREDESEPIVLALDRDQLLFVKEHPTAGIAPPVVHAVIAPGPERGVAVFSFVASMNIVAARMWADDANPYAEVEVFRPQECDELSVAYEAGLGWIAACASKNGTRAQRLRDDLTTAWAAEGVAVGTPSPVGRASLRFEGPSRWTLTQRAKAVGGDRELTFLYGSNGEPL